MGTYLRFKATKPEHVNALFQYQYPEVNKYVVESAATILERIAYLKVDPKQKHLRKAIETINDWNDIFPNLSYGKGQIKLSGDELTTDDLMIIEFIENNQRLFEEIVDESGDFFPEKETKEVYWSLEFDGVEELSKSSLEAILDALKLGITSGYVDQEV